MESVFFGTDAEFLEFALEFYPKRPVRSILDCTCNAMRMWEGCTYRNLVTGMDIDPEQGPHIVGDNRLMEGIGAGSYDVLVYDPPHLPNQGRDQEKDFRRRFGLGGKTHPREDFGLVLLQARRILTENGIVLAKVTDYVHNHRYEWVLVDLILAVREAGMTPCDLVIKARKNPLVDPKWKNRHHVRKSHCYWLVARKGDTCE